MDNPNETLTAFLSGIGSRGRSRGTYLAVPHDFDLLGALGEWFMERRRNDTGKRGIAYFTEEPYRRQFRAPWTVKQGQNPTNCTQMQRVHKARVTGRPLREACWYCPAKEGCAYQAQLDYGKEASVFEAYVIAWPDMYRNAGLVVLDFQRWPQSRSRSVPFFRLRETTEYPIVGAFVNLAEQVCSKATTKLVTIRRDAHAQRFEETLAATPKLTYIETADGMVGFYDFNDLPGDYGYGYREIEWLYERNAYSPPFFEKWLRQCEEITFERNPKTGEIRGLTMSWEAKLPEKVKTKAVIVVQPDRTDVITRLQAHGLRQYERPAPVQRNPPGRPTVFDEEMREELRRSAHLPVRELRVRFPGASDSTLYRARRELRLKPP